MNTVEIEIKMNALINQIKATTPGTKARGEISYGVLKFIQDVQNDLSFAEADAIRGKLLEALRK